MPRTLRPLGDRVVLLPAKPKDTHDLGTGQTLQLVGSAVEQPAEATVIAVGPDVPRETLTVDQIVLYPKYAGTEVTLDGQTMLVMKASEVTGVIEGEAAPHARPDDRPDITQKDGSPIPVGASRITGHHGIEVLTPAGWIPKGPAQKGENGAVEIIEVLTPAGWLPKGPAA